MSIDWSLMSDKAREKFIKKHAKLFEICKAFWQSEGGKQTLREHRVRILNEQERTRQEEQISRR